MVLLERLLSPLYFIAAVARMLQKNGPSCSWLPGGLSRSLRQGHWIASISVRDIPLVRFWDRRITIRVINAASMRLKVEQQRTVWREAGHKLDSRHMLAIELRSGNNLVWVRAIHADTPDTVLVLVIDRLAVVAPA